MPTTTVSARNLLPTAIVAGGAGFIGSHLCERLLDQKVEVVCVDNMSSGKKIHLDRCFSSPNFHLLSTDAQALSLDRIVRAHYVFHIIDTQDHQPAPQANLDTLMASTTITRRLLDVAHKFRAKFLLASTADVSPTESQRIAEALTADYIKLHQLDARVVRLTDVYGPRIDLRLPNPIPHLLRQAMNHEPLTISGDGLHRLSPIYITDAIEGLMQAMFSTGTKSETFTLYPPSSVSEIDLAYKIKLLTASRHEIHFLPAKPATPPPFSFPPQKLSWKPTVSLEVGLRATITSLHALPPKISVSNRPRLQKLHPHPSLSPTKPSSLPLPAIKHRTLRLSWKSAFALSLLLMFFIIASPLAALALTTTLGISHLKKIPTTVMKGELDAGLYHAQSASKYLHTANAQLSFLGLIGSRVGFENQIYRLEKLLELATNISRTSTHLIQAGKYTLESSQIMLGKKSGDLVAKIAQAQAETTQAYELLSLASASLSINRPNLKQLKFASLGERYSQLEATVPYLQHRTATIRSLLTILPNIAGAPTAKKTYLVLLQNNAELRPTGGFIGSFGLITFENGKLLDFSVEDVYTADGQLKGHVEPPNPIKKHLGEGGWYLRDVNWDPDFPSTARQAEWFLQKELNRTVAGTIAINLFVAQNALEALGPLTIPDYNETITAQNLFERAEYHSEIDFFPGSTQKKDFLGAAARVLYTRIQTASDAELLQLVIALDRSLTEHQLLIALKDPIPATTFADNHWDGKIASPTCIADPCFSDYWNLVEANLGVNKANFFISRKLYHRLTIFKEDHLEAQTTITYSNSSETESWPAGTYKNYLRLYVPLGSKITQVTIDNQPVRLESIDITTEHDKTVFGFLVSVPIKTTSTVTITYTPPNQLSFSKTNPLTTYFGLFQKQSGIGADPFTIEIAFPAYLKPITTPPGSVVSNQTIILTTDTSQDRELIIQFVK